jgi:crossover junction endodeoxyribonuclease RuvC
MVVLGIDPGTANTGYGVVGRDGGRLVALDGGTIVTAAGLDPGARLAVIHERVGALLDEYEPDALAVEDLYFGANARSAFAVGQARGVVILAAGQRGLPCSSYTPQQVKAAVCGSGRAAKGQVQRMVQRLLSLADLPGPDHAADALAVAICHANGASLRAAVERGIGEAMPVTAAERSGEASAGGEAAGRDRKPRSARQTRGRA